MWAHAIAIAMGMIAVYLKRLGILGAQRLSAAIKAAFLPNMSFRPEPDPDRSRRGRRSGEPALSEAEGNLLSSLGRWTVWSGHSCPLPLTLILYEAWNARNGGPTVEERRFSAD
jgi:hypothetical protein